MGRLAHSPSEVEGGAAASGPINAEVLFFPNDINMSDAVLTQQLQGRKRTKREWLEALRQQRLECAAEHGGQRGSGEGSSGCQWESAENAQGW